MFLPLLLASIQLSLLQLDQVPLEECLDREVEVRGYVKQSQQGEWFLTSDSNLPSCCAGSLQKQQSQLALGKGFPGIEHLEGKLLQLKGIFRVQETFNESGRPIRTYHLDSLVLEEKKNYIISLILIFIFVIFFFRILKKKGNL